MNIKDFEVGQEVYSLHEQIGRTVEDEIKKVTVVSVGRKYVTTSSKIESSRKRLKGDRMSEKIYFTHKIEITPELAFEMLCKSLYMDCVADEDGDYIIKGGQLFKKEKHSEKYELYDDRGPLFVALRNVAVNIFPNVYFRSDPYIYDYEMDFEGEDEEDAAK